MGQRTEERDDGPVKQRYLRLSRTREPYLAKARKCAELTIPAFVVTGGASDDLG